MFAVDLRNEILRRKQKNRALGDRRKLLGQWMSVYESYHLNNPGKDHRRYAEMYWRERDEYRALTLEINLNGSLITSLRLQLRVLNNDRES